MRVMQLLDVFEMIAFFNPKKLRVHKMFKHTLKIWQQLLKDFYEVHMNILRKLGGKVLIFENI